jgi:hypothetical protein
VESFDGIVGSICCVFQRTVVCGNGVDSFLVLWFFFARDIDNERAIIIQSAL